MRKILYFAGMALMATLALASCKDDNGKDDGGNGGGGAQRLAVPQLVLSDTTETSVTVSWGAIENAATYTYVFNDGEEASTAETSFIMETPEAGKYTFRVKAVPAEGSKEYIESQYSSTITYECKGAVAPPSEGLSAWLGTYEFTSANTLSASVEGDEIVTNLTGNPKTFEIVISPYDGEGGDSLAYVWGWSGWASEYYPGLGQLLPDGSFALLTSVSLGEDTENPGTNIEWMLIAQIYGVTDIPDGYITTINGPVYSYILTNTNGSIASSVVAAGELDGGGTYEGIGMDIFGNDGQYTYFYNLPWDSPAGNLTATKTSDDYNIETGNISPATAPVVYAADRYFVAR